MIKIYHMMVKFGYQTVFGLNDNSNRSIDDSLHKERKKIN